MSDQNPEKPADNTSSAAKSPSSPSKKPRGRALKYAGLGAGGLLGLLVILYFVVTSSGFITGVILPKVGKAIGAELTASSVSLSPFSSIEVRDVKVKTIGDELLLETASLKARYNLRDILGGTITVTSVEIDSPTVRLIQQPDGKTNLDPILEALASEEPKPKSDAKTVLNIGPVTLKNANLHVTQHAQDGSRTVADIRGLNLKVDGVRNNQPLKADLDGAVNVLLTGGSSSDSLAASLKGTIQTELDDDLLPKHLQTDLNLAVAEATGAFSDAAQLGAALTTDLTLTDIKQLGVKFSKAGAPLGQIAISGPFDVLQQEGKLKIDVTGIGNEVLSLVGAQYGIYFGSTKIAAQYEVELANQARTIRTTGTLTGNQFSVRQGALTTPTLDLKLDYNVAIDLPKSTAVIRDFRFSATQGGRQMLGASLSKEMLIDWGPGADALEESALELTVNQLNLADWRAFLGTNVTAGTVSGKLNLTARRAGKDLVLDLDARLAGLAAQFDANRIEQADVQVTLAGQVTDLSKVALSSLSVQVAQAKQPVVSVKGSGALDSATMDAAFESEVEANLVAAARLLGNPDVQVSAGTLKFTGKVAQKSQGAARMDQAVSGNVRLERLTGTIAGNKLDRFDFASDVDVELRQNVLSIRKAAGTLAHAGQAGGAFDTSGQVNLEKLAGQVTFKLTDLNQHALKPFLAAALGGNDLKSVSIGANATATFDAQAGSTVKGDFQVANLVITDPAGQLPQTPLTAKVNLDAGLTASGVASLTKLAGGIQLGPDNGGAFDVTGRYELASQKAQFTLKLTDLNQHALRPFLAGALGETKLASVSINANVAGGYDPKGASAVKGDVQVAKLLLTNPNATLPKDPLAIGLTLDTTLDKQVLDLKQLQLKLSPTARAKNELNVNGRVDLNKPEALGGSLKIAAESLDVTPYYDMFTAPTGKPATATPASASAKPAAPAEPAPEPAPVTLPIGQFSTDLNIGRLFLREIAISNLVTGLKLETSRVQLNPFKLTWNGAPVTATADVNLAKPGYEYTLMSSVDRLPLGPVVDSFVPAMKGKAAGQVLFNANIAGAGVTGRSLQQNLKGGITLTLTNGNVILPDPKQAVQGPLGFVVRTMSIVIGAVAPVLQVSLNDIIKPPIEWVDTKIDLGQGRIDLKHFAAQSPAFNARAAGTITLAENINDSPINRIPVDIALARELAVKARLAPAETPSSDAYVPLPRFVTLQGTIGEQEVKIDKLVIAKILGRSIGGAGGAIVEDAATTLKGVGGLLKGLTGKEDMKDGKAGEKPQEPVKINPFDLFKKKKE